MTPEQRVADLQRQHQQLGSVLARLRAQAREVRDQMLRCEGALQLAQTVVEESKAPAAPPAEKPVAPSPPRDAC